MNGRTRSIITDKLVLAKTGETMTYWFSRLDSLGAPKMEHSEIFGLVSGIPELEPLGQWNQNLLTTSYEWDRGLKGRGEKKDGFEISVSKTVNVPLNTLYDSFVDERLRKQWLGEDVTIRKSTVNKSARVAWSDKKTSLSVDFYPKSEEKAQIVVQHLKIPNAKIADKMKVFWGERLAELKSLLEA